MHALRVRFYLCFLTLIIVLVVPLHADTVSDLKGDISSLQDKINGLDKEIATFNATIKNTRTEQSTLKKAITSLESRRALLVKEIERTVLKIEQTNSSITQTASRIDTTEKKINFGKQAVGEVLRDIRLQDQSLPPLVGTLSTTRSLSDVMYEVKQQEDASEAMQTRINLLKNTKEQLADAKQAYEEHKEELQDLTSQLKDKRFTVEQSKQEKDKLLADTKSKEKTYQQLLADRKTKKNALEAELIDVEAKLRVAVDASKIPASGKGVLKYPATKPIITQYYGNTEFSTKNSQVYNGRGHNGIDLGMPVGTSLFAARQGTVLGTGNSDAACPGVSYGKWVLIRHDNGLTTLYAHMSRIDVSAGQKVDSLEKIGLSGNTGYSTGPHLHFTVYASDAVHIAGPTEYRSKVCGTYMIIPLAPPAGYLNPLSFL